MALQTDRQIAPRHAHILSLPNTHPHKYRPHRPRSGSSNIKDRGSRVPSNNNVLNSAALQAVPKIEVDDVGHMDLSSASAVPSTLDSTEPSDAPPSEPLPSSAHPLRKDPFIANGIPAYRTKATSREICRNFIYPTRWCSYGVLCLRIHPLDKAFWRKKHWGSLALRETVDTISTDAPVTGREDFVEQKKDEAGLPEPSQSLLLSDASLPTASDVMFDLPDSSNGWESNGAWKSAAKAENWTESSNSPASNNARLFSASSESSTPTTASPAPSDDEREERQDPPLRRNPFDSVCAIYRRSGRCPIGAKCMFKHVKEMDEPSAKPSESQETKACLPSIMPPVARPMNTTPVQSTTPPETPVPSQSTVPAPVRPSGIQGTALRPRHPRPKTTEICHNWQQKMCFYGHNCRWYHPDLEYDEPPSSALPKIFDSKDEFMLSFTLHDHMRVQCSAGFDIQRLQTAFESSTLLISNISSRVRSTHLEEVLASFGLVEELHMPSTFFPSAVLKVTYSDAAEAQKAQNALNGQKMFDLTLTAKIAASGTMKTVANAIMKDTSVRVTWEAPSKEVFAGYSNKADAERALEIARAFPLNGHYLRGYIYEGMPVVDMVNVHFWGVPLDVDKADMVRFVNPVDMMWTRPSYTEAEDGERFIRKSLWARGAPESFDILPPPYRDGGIIKAWATYPTAAKAKEAARHLDGRKPKCLGLTVVRAKHVHSISYSLSEDKFAPLSAAINALHDSRRGYSDWVAILPRNIGGAVIRLTADSQKELAHLKHQFETIVKGEIVRCDGKVVWDSFFSRPEGHAFLRRLEAGPPSVQIVPDTIRSHIRVHGYAVHRARVVGLITDKVKELRSQKKLQIALPGRLLGAALRSVALRALQDKHGLDNSHIDLTKRVMYVPGDFTLFRIFREAVDEIERGLPANRHYNGPICPICFGEPSSALRLQCGHTWCRECVAHYLRSAAERRSFPVKCLGNEGRCAIKIPITVAKEVLSTQEVMSLVESAFQSHIQSRPKEYRFCPSPDCPQVYRATSQKAALQCPSCLTSICTRCGSEAHDGFQCADQVQDELFKKWVKEHDVKHCPTCNVPIERTEGCNHMTCTRCQTHICWQCLKTFEGGQGIYGHMREVHGTFGLGQIFE